MLAWPVVGRLESARLVAVSLDADTWHVLARVALPDKEGPLPTTARFSDSQHAQAWSGHARQVTRTWDTALEGLPLEERLKALMAFELAADRAAGQPLEVARATVRAAASAEGLDTDHPWIDAAAAQISAGTWESL